LNTYQKGKRNERKAKRYYESQGYAVETVRYNMYAKTKDFWNLWDLLCVGEYDMRFVQVKTNQKPTKEWIQRAEDWGPKGSKFVKEYIVFKDYVRGDTPSVIVTFPSNC